MKKTSRVQMLDKLHIWSVRTLMGITLVGCATMTMQLYNYFTNIRPKLLEDRRIAKEIEIAMEQEEREAELRRRQKDAETLIS